MSRPASARISPGKLWSLLTPAERRRALVLLLLMLVGMLLETLGIGLVIPLIQLISRPDYVIGIADLEAVVAALGSPRHEMVVAAAVIALVGLYVVKALFLAFLAWREMSFTFDVQAEISQRLFTNYLQQPYTFHLQRNSAQLIRNVIGEVYQFIANCVMPALQLVAECLVTAGLCVLLLVIEPLGAMVVVCVLGAAAWGFHRLTRRHLTRWGEARQMHEGLRLQRLQEGLGGAKDVILLGRAQEFLQQYGIHNWQTARVTRFQKTLQQLPRLWIEVLAVAGLAALILTMLVQGRTLAAIVPTLGLFAATAFRLIPSANRIIGALQTLRYGMPVVDILHQELSQEPPPAQGNAAGVLPFERTLALEAVTCRYQGVARPALDDVTVRVGRGETVGVIGSSGAGKSTLVDVLLGLISPESGAVMVDGADVHGNLRGWQDQIGYVPQAIFLSDDSLKRNVAFGVAADQIDTDAVWRSLAAARLDDLARTLPDGIETPVGERGVRLSGGQRQRIGIARALYHNPSVLVLDEATSALDSATEREVMQTVRALQKEKTIVIVAHRLTTLESCDRIYRLDQGRLVQEGTPEQIIGN